MYMIEATEAVYVQEDSITGQGQSPSYYLYARNWQRVLTGVTCRLRTSNAPATVRKLAYASLEHSKTRSLFEGMLEDLISRGCLR